MSKIIDLITNFVEITGNSKIDDVIIIIIGLI